MALLLSYRHGNQAFLFYGADVERWVGEEVVGTAVGMDIALALAGDGEG